MISPKTLLLLIILATVSCVDLSASPAYPGLISFVQPNGSFISIFLKGDESVKWAETEDGYSVLFNSKGYYEYAILNDQGDMAPSGIIARNMAERSAKDLSFLLNLPKHLKYSLSQIGMSKQIGKIAMKEGLLQKSFPTTGSRKLLCILMEFTDRPFTKTQSDFENLFNQANYTVNGATGSVNKFFYESSYGKLNLSVTVTGPYLASNTMSYYGANDPVTKDDLRPRELVTEAVLAADPYVDYAQFDNDLNGTVDGVYVIYAGYGEEAGGSPDYIWAHAWAIPTETLDGKIISSYSCSPELAGSIGSNITNIGVICHEYGHILGAPDFYDTNYETDGQYPGTGYWDLQSSGSWNNDGKTPAQPNPFTKCYVYDWALATTLSVSQTITLANSAQNAGSFYRINTTTDNEYFLIENRQKLGFDAYVPGHGLLVYHVDQDYLIANSYAINAGEHQGMYVMSANSIAENGISTSDVSTINTSLCTFSAANGKTSFTDTTVPWSKSWAGAQTAKPITNIAENNSNHTVTLDFMGGYSCTPPENQATNFQAVEVTDISMTISWNRGAGDKVMVVAHAGEPTNSEPFNGVAYTADGQFASPLIDTDLGNGNYVIYNESGTSVKVTGLDPGIIYFYSIYEYNSSASCYTKPALTGSAMTTGYRESYGNIDYKTSITNVGFNTINNASIEPKTKGYSDYTAIKTAVSTNSTYLLTVKVNTDGNYPNMAYAWIDWNHNCDFDDPGETYNLGMAQNVIDGLTSASPLSITVPANAVNGPTRMRVSNKYSSAPTAYETDFDGEVEDYTIVVTSPVTWTGNNDTDTNWHTANNWEPVGVPTAYNNVTVPHLKNDPIIVSSSVSYDLTLENGAKLTVGTLGSLTVNGNLIKDAVATGLVLESASNGTGSLKILGSMTGSATVNRFVSDSKWHVVSAPANQTIASFIIDNKDIPYIGDKLPVTYGMMNYNDASDIKWDYFKETLSTNLLGVGKGYMVRTMPDDYTPPASPKPTILKFMGAVNTGTTNVPVIAGGWNCVGNPFTTAININSLASNTSGGTNFLAANSSVLTGSYGAIYVWDETKSTTEYQVINNSGDATYAQVGQGFFVKSTGPITFTSDMQVHQGGVDFKVITIPYAEIKLTAKIHNSSVSTTIKFIEGTTRGLDVGYDAGLFKSNDSLAIFTKLVEDNGVKFQLQCLPTKQYDKLVIPIGIDSKSGGEIVFTVQTVQLAPNCKVILEDKLTNTFTDLSKDTYKTTVAANTAVSDRFFLHTADIVSGLGVQEISSGKLRAYAVGNLEIRVIGEVSGMSVATLYNGLGKVVLTKKLGAGNLNIIGLPNLGSGVYFLNINDNGTPQTIKVEVRK